MKGNFKFLLVLTILLLGCVCVGSTFAADISVNDDFSSVDNTNVQIRDDLNHNGVNNLNDEFMGSFSDLNNVISGKTGIIDLDMNYTYDKNNDSKLLSGITISSDNVVIDGHGCIIDGSNLAKAFNVTGSNVTIKNINFINLKSNDYSIPGAVYYAGDYGSVIGCSFTNCNDAYGGAIFWAGDYGSVIGCSFTDCTASNIAGGIFWAGDYGSVIGCSFTNCNSTKIAGAVYWFGPNGNISNCSFIDCTATYGGAFYYAGDYGIIENITLNNCNALNDGVIYWAGANGIIDGCNISMCGANHDGIIYWTGNNGVVDGCAIIFVNVDHDGIIYWTGNNGTLNNAQFYLCGAVNEGAIYWVGDEGVLINSFIIDCNATNAKVYWTGDNGAVINCSFVDSLLSQLGGNDASGIYFDNTVNSTVNNCLFIVDTSMNEGAGIYCNNVSNLNVLKSIFTDISGSYGGGIYCYDVTGSIKNSIFFNCNAAHGLGNAIYLNQSDVDYEDNLFNIPNTFTTEDFEVQNFIYDNGSVVPNNVIVFNIRLTDDGYIIETVNNGTKKVVPMPVFKVPVELNDSDDNVEINVEHELKDKSIISVRDFAFNFLAAPPFDYNITYQYVKDTYILFIDTHQGLLVGDVKGNFTVKVGDKEFIGELDEGSVSIPLTGLKPGDYTLDIYYSGDDYNLPFNTTFDIHKLESNIVVDSVKGKSGEKVTITVRVTDTNGNPINEGFVTIKFNGKEYKAQVVYGIATVEVVLPSAGKYTATASYEGLKYATASYDFTVEVSEVPGPNPNPIDNGNMENTGNPLFVLLVALCVIGLESLRRKF